MDRTRKNKNYNPLNCPVTHFLNLVGGKWKVMIIYAVSKNYNRFSKLQKAIPMISKQMLVNQLRELEEDQILERVIFPEIPPRVEYTVTPYGLSLMPVIKVMQDWGVNDLSAINKI